jgi:hypothetical protein
MGLTLHGRRSSDLRFDSVSRNLNWPVSLVYFTGGGGKSDRWAAAALSEDEETGVLSGHQATFI